MALQNIQRVVVCPQNGELPPLEKFTDKFADDDTKKRAEELQQEAMKKAEKVIDTARTELVKVMQKFFISRLEIKHESTMIFTVSDRVVD